MEKTSSFHKNELNAIPSIWRSVITLLVRGDRCARRGEEFARLAARPDDTMGGVAGR